MSPEGFANRFEILAKDLGENLNEGIRKLALAIDRDVVLSTPVDTGRARANWFVSLNSPITDFQWARKDGSGGLSLSQAAQAISARKDGDTIYITNNLPYIGALNRGWSKQAPPYFVQMSVANGIQAIREIRLLKR